MKKMPQVKVTKRKEENKKIERIIEILQPVPEQKESRLSNNNGHHGSSHKVHDQNEANSKKNL